MSQKSPQRRKERRGNAERFYKILTLSLRLLGVSAVKKEVSFLCHLLILPRLIVLPNIAIRFVEELLVCVELVFEKRAAKLLLHQSLPL